jgi:hypothetical protein
MVTWDAYKIWMAVLLAAFFGVIVIAGSLVASQHLDQTANLQQGLAVPSGKVFPNGIKERQAKKIPRDSSTSGSQTGIVPLAPR